MEIRKFNPILQPRLSRPTDWHQGASDLVTIGAGGAAGAFLGAPGAALGGVTGAAAESMVAGQFPTQDSKQLVKRQALVGMLAGLGATAVELAFPGTSPLVAAGVGLVTGTVAAMALPGRAQSPIAEHWNNLDSTQAPQLWKEGLTGDGVGVAVLDTGIQPGPGLARVVAFHDFVEDRHQPHDVHHHGTGMSAILGGHGKDGKYPGVAPNVHLIGLKVADADGKLDPDRVKAAIHWATENRARYNIQVLNMSFTADPGDDPEKLAALNQAVEEAASKGIVVVSSAGNDGPEPTPMMSPATAPSTIAVASHRTGKDRAISEFSHRSAPGEAHADASAPGENWLQPGPEGHLMETGTSHAGAAMSGVMALWKQAFPEMTAADAQKALSASSRSLGADAEVQGAGEVQAKVGLEFLRKLYQSQG